MKLQEIVGFTNSIFKDLKNSPDGREKVPMNDFVKALIFSLTNTQTAGARFSINAFRQTVCGHLKKNLARSTFWEKLASKKLSESLETVLHTLVESTPLLDGFKELMDVVKVSDIILTDSSINSLDPAAAFYFPGTFPVKNSASIKLHNLFSLRLGNFVDFRASAGADHDFKHFPFECMPYLKNKLLIADLGYFKIELFNQIRNHGGYFLSRLKKNSVVKLKSVLIGLSQKGHHNGKGLADFKRKHSDVIAFKASMKDLEEEATVVGFWNNQEFKYHFYITNLTCDLSIIYKIYRLRWQIELVFKGLKTHIAFDEIPSADPAIIKSFFLARMIFAIVGLAFSRGCIKIYYPESIQSSESILRRFSFFCRLSEDLYRYVSSRGIACRESSFRELKCKIEILQKELIDPNRRKRSNSMNFIKPLTVAA